MTRQPTRAEVRRMMQGLGFEVRITRAGHVTFRRNRDHHPGASTQWLDGRNLTEYRLDNTSDQVFFP